MTEHHGKGPEEQHQSAGHQVIVHGRDNAAYDAGQTDHTQSGHQRLYRWKALLLRIRVVQETANGHRDNRHDEDVEKHADGVYLDNLTSRQLHQQRSHHRCQ